MRARKQDSKVEDRLCAGVYPPITPDLANLRPPTTNSLNSPEYYSCLPSPIANILSARTDSWATDRLCRAAGVHGVGPDSAAESHVSMQRSQARAVRSEEQSLQFSLVGYKRPRSTSPTSPIFSPPSIVLAVSTSSALSLALPRFLSCHPEPAF